jgi:hypothetical protein
MIASIHYILILFLALLVIGEYWNKRNKNKKL